MDPLSPVSFKKWQLNILDQTLLPAEERYVIAEDHFQVAEAIRTLKVRGAPAIGIAAGYGLILGVRRLLSEGRGLTEATKEVANILKNSRPTAVNLSWAVDRLVKLVEQNKDKLTGNEDAILELLLKEASEIERDDLLSSEKIAKNAYPLIKNFKVILTHCNTGALATGGLGTALFAIRYLHSKERIQEVVVTETRPLWQGARLTTWELEKYGIPYVLIVDAAAAYMMRYKNIAAVMVGADRVAANGDTANKIGTLTLSLLAKAYGIPFYVLCPTSSIDLSIRSGEEISIEFRDAREISEPFGLKVATNSDKCLNPAFDITPFENITAIITEKGIFRPLPCSTSNIETGSINEP